MSAADATIVTVTKTFVEMVPEQFKPTVLDDPAVTVVQSHEPLPEFYRFLYGTVGRDFEWVDRLGWSDDELRAYLGNPAITVLVLYVRGTPAGYIELDATPDEAGETGTNVAYFGLFPAFHGRGLGKHLLSVGVQRAFDDGAARVWLNTNTLDGRHALANYRARGFVPYKTETYQHRMGQPDA